MKLTAVILFATACLSLTLACNKDTTTPNTAGNGASSPPAIETPTPRGPSANIGLEMYATNCMICHRDTGKGGKITLEGKTINPEDLTAEKLKKATDEKLINYIRDGVPDEGMPAFKGKLTDDQIIAIVKHIRSLQS